MKKTDLHKIVREAIQEVLNEDAASDKAAQDAKKIVVCPFRSHSAFFVNCFFFHAT